MNFNKLNKYNMNTSKKYARVFLQLFIMVAFIVIAAGCKKDVYVEPEDPYEKERLNSDHINIIFGDAETGYVIKTNTENVETTESGNIRIRGTLYTDNDAFGPMKLTSGDFIFFNGANAAKESYAHESYGELPVYKGKYTIKGYEKEDITAEGFAGFAEFNIPKVGFLQELMIPFMEGSPIGYVNGSELEDWPLNPDRKYFYFDYSKLNSSADGVEFKIKESTVALDRIAIDPFDPFLYMHAGLDIPKLPLNDIGFGLSLQGNINFEVPEHLQYGKIEGFDNGNILIEGSVDLSALLSGVPIGVGGQIVLGFPTGNWEDITNFFDNQEVYLSLGASGQVTLDADYIPMLGVELLLGEAVMTAFLNPSEDRAIISFVGQMEQPSYSPRELFEELSGADVQLLDYLNMGWEQTFTVWGSAGISADDWLLGIKNEVAFVVADHTIISADAMLEIDKDHIYVEANAEIVLFGEAKLIGDIKYDGSVFIGAYCEAHFDETFAGLHLKIDFESNTELNIESNGDWRFYSKGQFYGEAGIDLPPWGGPFSYYASVSINMGYEAEIDSDGKFRVCANIGIDGFGFDVCMDFNKKGERHNMTVKNTDYKNIPQEKRYFSEKYKSMNPWKFPLN